MHRNSSMHQCNKIKSLKIKHNKQKTNMWKMSQEYSKKKDDRLKKNWSKMFTCD